MTDAAITALETRLKTVTARLEQVERQLAAGGGASSGASSSGAGASASSGGSSSAFVSAYEGLISQFINEYVRLSAQIDPDVEKQAKAVQAAVNAQRNFLDIASQSKKPADAEFAKLLQSTSQAISDVQKVNTKGKGHPKFNYLNTLAEGIAALGWVAVTPAPAPFVDEARASSEFYSNKILMEFKNKEGGDLHRNWVHAINEFLKELKNYVKQYHTTGVSWNPKGGDASSASASSGSDNSGAPPVPSGGGPPAPPPGGPPAADSSSGSAAPSGGGRGALLAEIDAVRDRQTGGRTSGLKHVTKDMKAKNRDPNDAAPVVEKKAPAASRTPAKAAAVTKPPRMELEGNKWVVEWQNGNKNIEIKDTETRQTVYIYKCENSVVRIVGKVNSIVVDGCKKTAVVFDNAIATVEFVNCQSVQLQVLGRVPNIAVDKTDGCQLHLSKECLDAEIITSKVSEMNINIPHPTDPHGDPIERPVPEQFKTVVKGTSLDTVAVQHLG
eukprot:TRINITY_DN11133_c0_g1_i1.p1 TRINITY_DN11133_c0_g1~~TRINITY_DN11133_c0_g1_i1.p1  ORF type:complete len:499 (+),score=160.06 TRINITY_DN11133_c0_g1_i1:82-1578(+)